MSIFRVVREVAEANKQQVTASAPTFNSGSVTGNPEWACDSIGNTCRWSVVLTADLTVVSATGGAAKGAGVKLFDFPTGLVQVLKSRITGTFAVTGTGDSTAGEIGLGSVVATGAVATLSTATWENMCEGGVPALGNATAGGAAVAIVTGDTQRSEIGTISTASACYLNAASTFAAGTGAFVVKSGTRIDVWYELVA